MTTPDPAAPATAPLTPATPATATAPLTPATPATPARPAPADPDDGDAVTTTPGFPWGKVIMAIIIFVVLAMIFGNWQNGRQDDRFSAAIGRQQGQINGHEDRLDHLEGSGATLRQDVNALREDMDELMSTGPNGAVRNSEFDTVVDSLVTRDELDQRLNPLVTAVHEGLGVRASECLAALPGYLTAHPRPAGEFGIRRVEMENGCRCRIPVTGDPTCTGTTGRLGRTDRRSRDNEQRIEALEISRNGDIAPTADAAANAAPPTYNLADSAPVAVVAQDPPASAVGAPTPGTGGGGLIIVQAPR
jgi:hypothetical protein